jgi:hypothetical protein
MGRGGGRAASAITLAATDVAVVKRETIEAGIPITGDLHPIETIGVRARIEGDRYRRDAFWGHLFNVHYLAPLQRELQAGNSSELKPFGENLLKTPRLFAYYGGKSPPPGYP